MPPLPQPPDTHQEFARRYPELAEAWRLTHEAGTRGPLDEKAQRLIKLGVALGAMREGAVHADVRKALAAGATREEVEQAVALAAGTIGFPGAVAVFTWVRDVLDGPAPGPR